MNGLKKGLKNENITTCMSILREFIEHTGAVNEKKGIARLALDQLHKITAGSTEGETVCTSKPRADIP